MNEHLEYNLKYLKITLLFSFLLEKCIRKAIYLSNDYTVTLPLYSTKKSKGTEVGLQDNLKVASSMLAILIV